jgi:YihY family inner membrane protein
MLKKLPRLERVAHLLWAAIQRYSAIDGEQRAAAFAYYAFFAIFPLVLLLVTIGTNFFSGNSSQVQEAVIGFVNNYIPVGNQSHNAVIATIQAVIKSRGSVSAVAVFGLLWTSLRFFQALVRGVNKAWGTVEYTWWRLPIKNAYMLCVLMSALLLGILMPLLVQAFTTYWERYQIPLAGSVLVLQLLDLARRLVPTAVLFYGFSVFYMLAPRGRKPFRAIWISALLVTVALQGVKAIFVLYAKNVVNFNAVYGAFGSVIATLVWIYLSGSIIIFGACLSAAHEHAPLVRTKPID